MSIAYVIDQETGLTSLLSKLPIRPGDYDINEAGDAGMSWEFPGPHFVQLEIPSGSQTATWIAWGLAEFHDETPEHHLDLSAPATWDKFIRTLEQLAC